MKTSFDDNFDVFLADTEESKLIHYSIRHNVYCEELKFENNPSGFESDQWDNNSVHFIVRHKLSKQWVGAVRLIIRDDKPLPIETFNTLDQNLTCIVPEKITEFSRLCIIKDVRSGSSNFENCNPELIRKIMWGLIRAALVYSKENDYQYSLILTTPSLAKILERSKMGLKQIGSVCEHRGARYPYKIDVGGWYSNTRWNSDFKQGYTLYSQHAD